MKFGKWLFKKIGHLLPADYGIFEKGSFPTKRKLNIHQAKSLILDGGQKNRWENETDFNFAFLKEHFFKRNQDKEILVCDYGTGIGRLAMPILKEFKKTKVVGVDESESLLELASKWIPQVFFDEKRFEIIKSDNFFKKYSAEKTFDLLLVVYVFQHIYLEELNQLIPALFNLLKDDGRLFIVNTFQNDDPDGHEIKMKDILEKYFIKEFEISPYENKDKYVEWMRFAGYGNWQKMENAKPRCQKFMGIYKKK